MVAKAIRNMQVPAYCPVVLGVQEDEKRAVFVAVKKVMAIESIPIILDESMGMEPSVGVAMGMEPSVRVAMGIAAMVPAEDPGIDISILISQIRRYR